MNDNTQNIAIIILLFFLVGAIWWGVKANERGQKYKELYNEEQKISFERQQEITSLDGLFQQTKELNAIQEGNIEELETQKKGLEEEQTFLLDRIESLKEEKQTLELLAATQDGHSEDFIEEIFKRREELDSLLTVALREKNDLTSTITHLEVEARNNQRYVQNLTQTLLKVLEITTYINEEVFTINEKALEAQGQESGIDALNEVDRNILGIKEVMVDAKQRLKNAENQIRQYESNQDSIFNMKEAAQSVLQTIKVQREVLEKREKQVLKTQKTINQRHFLVATREELIEMGLLVKKKRFNPFARKKNKYEFHLENIVKDSCQLISKLDKSIPIPVNSSVVSQSRFLTIHPGDSYSVAASNSEPSASTIDIFDKEEFWKVSLFVVIEVEDQK